MTPTKLILVLLLLTSTVKSSFGKGNNIIISGHLDTALIHESGSKKLILKFKNTSNSASKFEQIESELKEDGSFEAILRSDKAVIYLSFELQSQGYLYNVSQFSRDWQIGQGEQYLFEKGDSVSVNISKSGLLFFNGKGSEKLNCQFLMYLIEPLTPGFKYLQNDNSNKEEIEKKYLLRDTLLELSIRSRLALLNIYKNRISEHAYNLLYLDAVSSADYETFSKLAFDCYIKPIELNKIAAQEYYMRHIDKIVIPQMNPKYLAESAFFADLIFEKEFNYYKLFSPTQNHIKADSFKLIYERLKSRYTGDLRDKLIYIAIEKLITFYSEEVKAYIPEALSLMHNQTFIDLLTRLRDAESKFYSFKLQGQDGQIYQLEDFKEKVIVLDFWFTGCGPCAKLSTAMEPIIEKYKNNKDVKFINISTDYVIQDWIKSIAEGKYVSKEPLNLITNGEGIRHPVITYHNIKGFPKQFIIGKNKEIITSSPPVVSTTPSNKYITPNTSKFEAQANTKAFVAIIDNYLKNN